ncbi:hypothetical protein Tco_0888204 [Tanacetum coccineum]
MKKALKRSQRETTIHQVGGSGDGTSPKPGVPDEPKGKSVDTDEGTGLKPGVLDVSKTDSYESEYESWGDSGDEANVQGDDEDVQDSDDEPQQDDDERTDSENQETNDDEEESDDEFVHTPSNYVQTDDKTNDESNDVDEQEYDRIDKELYGDVNVSLTDVEQVDGDEEDAYMTDAAHVQVEQTQQQPTGNATTKVPPFSSSHSVSSNYTSTFLNLENLQSTKTKVVSMLDINVQHEVPRTSQLLTIPISVIPEHTVFNPSETVTTAPATTITSLLSSLFPNLHQSTLIPTPTNIEATTLTPFILEYKTFNHSFQKSILKSPNFVKEYLGTSLDDALYKVLKKHDADIIKEFSVPVEIVERLTQQYLPQQSTKKKFDQKTTLFNTMTNSKSFNKSPKNRALYHALMESILEDDEAIYKGVADELKKRKKDDVDKDEGPSAGSDRGLKGQRKSKGTKTSKKTSTTKDSSKGKSPTTSSKSSKSGKSAKDQVVEPIFVLDFDNVEHDDADYVDMSMDQGEELGKNEGKSVDGETEQSWLNDMAKAIKPPLTFDELMHTSTDFSAFAMNHLNIDNLTKEHLVGPVYNLPKGTCKSYVELDYTMEECYRALSEQLDWNNPEGHRCPYDLTKPLPVQMSSQGC